MDHAQILIGMAEVAIGVAGFAGIVFVIAGRLERTGVAVRTIIGMLWNAFAVVFQCLAAIALASQFTNDVYLWGYASIVGLVMVPVVLVPLLAHDRRLFKRFGGPDVPVAVERTYNILGLGVAVPHVMNLPVFGESTFMLFFVAVSFGLLTAIAQFLFLIYEIVLHSAGYQTVETPGEDP